MYIKASMKPNIFWIAVILWLGVIFYFSSKPADVSRKESGEVLVRANIIQQTEVNVNVAHNERESLVLKAQNTVRKMAHVIEYFIFGALLILALTYKTKINVIKVISAIIICVITASVDEFHQKFVPGRGPLVSDVVIDMKGCLMGIAFIIIIRLVVMLFKGMNSDKTQIVNN